MNIRIIGTHTPKLDFKIISCIDMTDFDEDIDDWALSLEMMRLMDNKERQILPHKENIKVINLGNGEDKKRNENRHIALVVGKGRDK